jgi:hypothetical protein
MSDPQTTIDQQMTNVITFPKPILDRPFNENILRVNAFAHYGGLCDPELAKTLTDQFMDFWRPHHVEI